MNGKMHAFLRTLPAALLALGGLSGAGSVSGVSASEKWVQIEMAHFTLFSDAQEKLAQEFGVDLERFREVLRAFHPAFEADSSRPTFVFIFKNRAAMEPFRYCEAGKPTDHAGYCVSGPNAVFIVLEAEAGAEASRMVYHEYTHAFLNYNLWGIPPWFNEGVADFYSTFQADEHGARIGLPRADYVDFLATATWMPLPQLFAVDAHSPEYHEGRRMGLFYTESWALVHYLLQGSAGGKPQVSAYLERLRREGSVEDVFQFLQKGPNEMLKELQRYIAARKFSATVIEYSDLKADLSYRVTPVDEEAIGARLKDLLAALDASGSGKNSVVKPEVVPTAQAREAQKEIGLGLSSKEKGDLAGAADHFSKAVDLNPEDATACYLYASLLLENPQLERKDGAPLPEGVLWRVARARELLSRAIQIRPDFFDAYLMLGVTYSSAAGDPSEGIKAVQQALRMRPTSKEAAINLIGLYLKKGDLAGAQRILDEVVAPMKDPALLEQMRREIQYSKPTADAQKREQSRGYQEDPEYASQIDALNQAVEQANQGDTAGAIAVLKRILPSIRDPALSRQAKEMLERLQSASAQPETLRP